MLTGQLDRVHAAARAQIRGLVGLVCIDALGLLARLDSKIMTEPWNRLRCLTQYDWGRLVKALSIGGAWIYTPQVWRDQRGSFFEMFRGQEFAEDLGYRFEVAQANHSVSWRGVIRGIHFMDVPPGQAKYVCCVSGGIMDVVVDLRVGSPTFKCWEMAELDAASGRALFLAEGLGHAFTALSAEATVVYLCSSPYNPSLERSIQPLDPAIGITWPEGDNVILSDRDAAAPGLEHMLAAGLLPAYDDCLEYSRSLRR